MTLSEARLTLLDPKDNPVMNGRYVIGVDRRGRAICFAPEVTGDTLREVFDEARKLDAKGPITVYGYTSLIAETATYRFRQLAAPPAAPASEPAVRPLSERIGDRFVDVSNADGYAGCLFADEVAALEAELADAKRDRDSWASSARVRSRAIAALRAEVEQLRERAEDAENERDDRAAEGREIARQRQEAEAEAEQLRGKLKDAEGAWKVANQATARVRSMREAFIQAAIDAGADGFHDASARDATDRIVAALRALPLDTGTATDAPGDATVGDTREGWRKRYVDLAASQADAIKAAVADANNRAADAFHAWSGPGSPETDGKNCDQFEAWLRSGEDAPGAVGK